MHSAAAFLRRRQEARIRQAGGGHQVSCQPAASAPSTSSMTDQPPSVTAPIFDHPPAGEPGGSAGCGRGTSGASPVLTGGFGVVVISLIGRYRFPFIQPPCITLPVPEPVPPGCSDGLSRPGSALCMPYWPGTVVVSPGPPTATSA